MVMKLGDKGDATEDLRCPNPEARLTWGRVDEHVGKLLGLL